MGVAHRDQVNVHSVGFHGGPQGSQGSYRPSGPTGSSSGSRPVTTTKKPRCDDPYKACEFNDPEDFYDYYYDDFEDYEEAYDYYYDHQHD